MTRIFSSVVKLEISSQKRNLISKRTFSSTIPIFTTTEPPKLSLFDQLTKNRSPSGSHPNPFSKSPSKPPKPPKVSLIDQLKDYKMQNMWEPSCRLFAKAHQSQAFQLRWQRFHVKNLLECLGNCYRWREIEAVWQILVALKKPLLDDSLANLVLNMTAIRQPGVDCLGTSRISTLSDDLATTDGIDGLFRSAGQFACQIAEENPKLPEKPLFLRVFQEIHRRGLRLDHYGSRGFVIGVCRAGMWAAAARLASRADRMPFNPPAVPSDESAGDDDSKHRPFYAVSEIEISEIIRKSTSTALLEQVIAARYQPAVDAHAMPSTILLAAMAVQPTWEKSLEVIGQNHRTQIDASLINQAVSLAHRGSNSSVVVQGVFDYFMERVRNPAQFGSNALPLVVVARGITKAYEITIQAYAREGNWREALHQLYVSQKQNVPLSIDLHGSVLRALNKANRPVDIINSFLAMPGKDENPIGKKSLLKTLSLINAYTDCKRRRGR